MLVKSSLCGYQELKKSDNYVVELAARAQDPGIRKLAVEMLNEYHVEVCAAQEDPANQELLRLLKRERQAQEKQQEAQDELRSGAKVVPEKGLNVDLKNIVDSKSKRLMKRPERFSDIKWTDFGKRGATISAEELRAHGAIDLREEEDGSSDDFEESDSSAFESNLEYETHERPLTDKQRAKLDSKAARKVRPTVDDAARQLAIKMLDDYDRVDTEKDLDEDVHLA